MKTVNITTHKYDVKCTLFKLNYLNELNKLWPCISNSVGGRNMGSSRAR